MLVKVTSEALTNLACLSLIPAYPDTGQEHGDVDVGVVDGDESSNGRAVADSFDDRLDRLAGHFVDQLPRVLVVPDHLADVGRLARPLAFSGGLGGLLHLLQGSVVAVVADLGKALSDQLAGHVLGLIRIGGADEKMAVVSAVGRVHHGAKDRLADQELPEKLSGLPAPGFVLGSGRVGSSGPSGHPGDVDLSQGEVPLRRGPIARLASDHDDAAVKNLRATRS